MYRSFLSSAAICSRGSLAERTIKTGPIPESDRFEAFEVVELGFGQSSSAVLPDRSAQLWILASRLLNLPATIGGFSGATLSGVDGLRTNAEFVFDGLNLALLRRELGISAFRARAAVRILVRPLEPGTIRIQFVADDSMARSQGIPGSMLGAVDSLSSEANAGRVELLSNHKVSKHDDSTNGLSFFSYRRCGNR